METIRRRCPHKLRSYFTKHKDKTAITETKNAIYIIPCGDCSRYIGQTSKKIAIRITEHKNAIKRHDPRSLPATHTYDNCHTFNWATYIGRAQTKYAREFKEAWHSTDDNTINRHIDIPTVYLQLKTVRKNSVNNDTKITNTNIVNLPITLQSISTTHSYNASDTLIPNNNVKSSMTTHLHTVSTTNDKTPTCKEPIRRSERIATARNLNIVHICK